MHVRDSDSIGTYKLSATPSLVSEGQFRGELRGVEFLAVSSIETVQWFAINGGQFQTAFAKLIPYRLAEEIVEALARGQEVEFPGLYRREQFGSGFHSEYSPPFSLRDVGRMEDEATA
jgi:hypothetical protein